MRVRYRFRELEPGEAKFYICKLLVYLALIPTGYLLGRYLLGKAAIALRIFMIVLGILMSLDTILVLGQGVGIYFEGLGSYGPQRNMPRRRRDYIIPRSGLAPLFWIPFFWLIGAIGVSIIVMLVPGLDLPLDSP